MRDLRRNRQIVHYAQYLGERPLLDSGGFETGETGPEYTELVEARVNVSPATGDTITQTFGDLPNYSKVIAVSRPFPIDEKTVFWIDSKPDHPHDYKVIKVAKSLNGWLYALEGVTTSSG